MKGDIMKTIDLTHTIDENMSIFPGNKPPILNRKYTIENLTNLSAIEKEFFILSVLPLKSKLADGSPVRAIAIESMGC